MSSKISIRLQRWIPFIIIAIGAIFRIRQLLLNRSLWLDEALLANNIVTHSLKFLLTQPLDNQQAAPWGFLFSLKLFGKIFGYHDYVFRLVPFIASLLFLLVCERLSRSLKKPLARYGFLALISFSPILIYYSSEVKQYIFDIFFAIFLLWIALNYQKWKFGYLILGISGIVSILFSQPSVFVLAAIGIYEVLVHWVQKQSITVFRLISIGLVWLFVFAGMYYLSTRFATANTSLLKYWDGAFAPIPRSLVTLKWYSDSLLALVYNGFAGPSPLGSNIYPQWYTRTNIFFTVITYIGLIFTWKHNKTAFWITSLTTGFVLIASGFHFYPFRSRPILFLVPFVYFWLCSFIDWLLSKPFKIINIMSIIIIVVANFILLKESVSNFINPIPLEDIKSCLGYIELNKQDGDQLALSEWSAAAYNIYKNQYNFSGITIIDNVSRDFNLELFVNSICQKNQIQPTWILFYHRFSQAKGFVAELSKIADLTNSYLTNEAGVFYFNFHPERMCP